MRSSLTKAIALRSVSPLRTTLCIWRYGTRVEELLQFEISPHHRQRRKGSAYAECRKGFRLLGGSMELVDANPGTIVKVLLPMTAPSREALERD